MIEALSFFVPMVPRRKNRLKIVRVGGFHKLAPDEKGKEAQDTLAARTYEHRPSSPINGPVRLDVAFVMPIPTGWPAWKKTAAREGRFHHVSRPDRGNLLKLLEDALKGPFYSDDSVVVAGNVAKSYGDVSGYKITLSPLHQATRASEAQAP